MDRARGDPARGVVLGDGPSGGPGTGPRRRSHPLPDDRGCRRPLTIIHGTTKSRQALALKAACLSARLAEENKSRDPVVLDLRGLSAIVDFFVIATGTSRRQMHAVADEIERAMADQRQSRLGIEGYQSSRWILLDYGDLVVHLFDDEARKYYDLEGFWADAPRLDWRG